MFLKIINNNFGYMASTAVYEMDNIEYFLLPLWQVTYNNWEEQNKARKEYAYVTSLTNEANCTFIGNNYIGDKHLDFIHQMNPLPRWASRESNVIYKNGFDVLGVKHLINWTYSLQPHWFKNTRLDGQTPVLLYVDRNPIQLHETDLHGTQMPYVYFIRLLHKNPENDIIIITNMRKVYLLSDDGKTIERLSKGVELSKEKEIELKRNYFTKEYFESHHTKYYNSIAHSLENNHYFDFLSSTEIESLEKEIKEQRKSVKPFYKAVEEANNKYAAKYWETNEDKEEESKKEQTKLSEQNKKE